MLRSVSALVATIATAWLMAGCNSAAPSTPPIRPTPPATAPATPSLSELLLGRGRSQLPGLLAGATAPPFVVPWSDIESLKLLPPPQRDAFCDAIQLPHIDDGLTAVIYAGLSALSEKVAHVELPKYGDKILGIAVTYAVKNCENWVPKAAPASTPTDFWFPTGYRAVIGNPNLAWADRRASEYRCAAGERHCVELLVVARYGCPISLTVAVNFTASDGGVVDSPSLSAHLVPALKVQIMHLGTAAATGTGPSPAWISCL